MPTAWYLCPYKLKRLHMPARYVAMDDLTPEIRAVGGEWAETEIDNNRAAFWREVVILGSGINDGRWCGKVTAFNAAGSESGFSEEACGNFFTLSPALGLKAE